MDGMSNTRKEIMARLGAFAGGAKVEFALAVPELDALHSSLGNTGQIITDARSVKKDRALLEKIDAAYRTGDYTAAANGWRSLSVGSRVTPMGEKFKHRMEISGYRFSRPGAKAEMGRAEDIYRKLSSGSVTKIGRAHV